MIPRALAFIVLLIAAPAPADPVPYFYRADGRKVELRAEVDGDALVIPVPGEPRPLRLERQIIVRIHESLPGHPTLSGLGLEVVRSLGDRPHTWILSAENATGALHACAHLVESDQVLWAVPDFQVPVQLAFHPDDRFYSVQWHLNHSSDGDISAEAAWDLTRGDPQVVVAILDTGVDAQHEDLDYTRMVHPRNTLADIDDASPTNRVIDAHGTACAGLIVAAQNNEIGVSGVCPHCSWMPVRLLDGNFDMSRLSDIAEGVYWAVDHGAWVLSNSWYIPQAAIENFDVTPIRDAILAGVNTGRDGKGCVFLFATGNARELVGPDEFAAMDETVAVGGCGHNSTVTNYSNFGPYVSVVAPTHSGINGDPRIVTLDTSGDAGANNQGIWWHYDENGDPVEKGLLQPDPEGHYTAFFGGTSAATPIAAGVAALVLSANPDLTYLEVMQILQSTAEKIGEVEYDDNGHHDDYGYGRVHAERAVAMALYGQNNPDGKLCRLDLNCENECLDNPPIGEGPVCKTPCAATTECGDSRICHQGYCYPEFLLLLVDDTCEPEPEIKGTCAHAPGGSVGFLMILLALLFRFRRLSPA